MLELQKTFYWRKLSQFLIKILLKCLNWMIMFVWGRAYLSGFDTSSSVLTVAVAKLTIFEVFFKGNHLCVPSEVK